MKFDPNSTINQGRWRLRDPKDFERMWTVKTKSPGVTYIAGFLKTKSSDFKKNFTIKPEPSLTL